MSEIEHRCGTDRDESGLRQREKQIWGTARDEAERYIYIYIRDEAAI